jgi:hypothetical protein
MKKADDDTFNEKKHTAAPVSIATLPKEDMTIELGWMTDLAVD